jgi:protein transport protein DSL1/ZW10
MRTLAAHSALAQQTQDAQMNHEALSYLLKFRTAYGSLMKLVQEGHLARAVEGSASIQELLSSAPTPLPQTQVLMDIKVRPLRCIWRLFNLYVTNQRKFRALQDRVQEQLDDAFIRSIIITSTNESSILIISPQVKGKTDINPA